mgnify:CR=1 FL=1
MSTSEILAHTKERMKKSEDALLRELGSIRAGRANASLLDRLEVEYYGALTPVNQLASITVPEARMLLITPYDKSSLNDIERAILMSDIGITPTSDGSVIRLIIPQSDLGLNPGNDGAAIRLTIPQLTEERRKELAKQVGKEAESAKVSVRNIRRDAIDQAKKAEKAKEITEDELHTLEKDIQKVTDESVKNIDKLAANKEKELLEV